MTVAELPAALRASRIPIQSGVAVLVDDKVDARLQSEVDALERQHRPVRVIRLDDIRWPDVLATNVLCFFREPFATLLGFIRALRHPLARMQSTHVDSILGGAEVHACAGARSTRVATLLAKRGSTDTTGYDDITNLDWSALGATSLGVQRLNVRPGSIIGELVVWEGSRHREVVVKIQPPGPNDPRPASESARIEYEILTALRETMTAEHGGITFTVPRALLLDEPRASVIMERAHGTPLDGLIRTARRWGDPHTLDTPVRLTGEWLRRMQASTRTDEDGRHLLTSLVLLGINDLDVIAGADAEIRGRRDDVARYLRKLEERVAEGPLPVVGHHEDFWPGNVFIGERSVEVIDFEGFREGLPLEDAVYLLSYLEMLPLFGRHYGRLRAAFLEGFLDGQPLDPQAFELFRLLNTLRGLSRNLTDGASGFRARYVRRKLRQIILGSTELGSIR
ncbi:MAG TPA: aminoglycoside phosphotransferase family protein [Thermoanaerobaculia bacterium]|nr:aminoglycoside phosphotransferase family protein [Thermoanaerobaculia bacterium]